MIGGFLKRSKLSVPELPGLRPTPDRVRETLFNWLAPVLHGARVLDLCAGTGVLGIEAISRGAAHALLNEPDPRLADAITAALQRLKITERARITRMPAQRLLAEMPVQSFDVVFVDPPYGSGLWPKLLAELPPWLAAGACVYLEYPADQAAPWDSSAWVTIRESRAGQVRFALLEQAAGSASLPAHPTQEPAP